MTTHKEALTLALEWADDRTSLTKWQKARAAIKEALAKLDKIAALQQKTESHDVDCLCSDCAALDDLEEALAQPEQEPVAWGFQNSAITGSNRWMMLREEIPANDQYGGALWTPLYTTPPQRTWVGLTEDEAFACKGRDYFETYKAIEAKLKEKNT